MSLINAKTSTADWLLSLPKDLRDDIASSEADLAPAIAALLEAVNALPLPGGSREDMSTHLESFAVPLSKLLVAIEDCSLAVNWTAEMTHDKQSLLLYKINSLRIWVRINRQISPTSTKALACCRIIRSIQPGAAIAPATATEHLWHTIFNIFCPPPPVGNSSITAESETPIRPSSGNQMIMGRTHIVIDPAIKYELDGLIHINTPRFQETFFIPRPASFDKCGHFRRAIDNSWKGWPDDANQDEVSEWIVNVSTPLLDAMSVDRNYYATTDHVMDGTQSIRMVDVVLYPTTKGRRWPKGNANTFKPNFHFQDVLVVGELKSSANEDTRRDLIVQLAGYVRLIFYTQFCRRFVHAFTLTGNWMRCYIFHRGGGFASDKFNINAEPQRFIDIIVGYAAMTPEQLGFDTTLVFDKYKFRVEGEKEPFVMKRGPIFRRESIASRGTTCWELTRRGDHIPKYILKDTWRNSLYPSEAKFFQKAQEAKVKGLVRILACPPVLFQGAPDDIASGIMRGLQVAGKPLELVTKVTKVIPQLTLGERAAMGENIAFPNDARDARYNRRNSNKSASSASVTASSNSEKRKTPPTTASSNSGAKRPRIMKPTSLPPPPTIFNRIHTRIIMERGRDLHDFRTPRELLLGLHDAIVGHRSLLLDAGILHRDISIYNIMLTSPTNPRPDGITGFLIDLDMAVFTGAPPSGALHRTGTMEFMAISVLRGTHKHTYRHDLESFWYVLIWMCVYGGQRRRHVTPLSKWAGGDMLLAADAKRANVVRGDVDGYQTIENCWRVDCIPLMQVADQWRRFLFPLVETGEAAIKLDEWEDVEWAYGKVLGILKEAAELLK